MKFKSINPETEKIIGAYSLHSNREIEKALEKSKKAFQLWRTLPLAQRAAAVRRLGEVLLSRRQEFANTMTLEMGKPVTQGLAEIDKCAFLCNYYADHASSFLKDQIVVTQAKRSLARFIPLGGILGVMPWNFPFWQVFRFAVPTLLAGNSVLLKHAPNVLGTAAHIEKSFHEAGFLDGIFQNLRIDIPMIKKVVSDPFIQGVSFTGSTRAGSSLAALAGKYLKKSVLELGGSDPYLILEDADLELAAAACAQSRLINSGQSCIAAKRFIVAKPIVKKFTEIFVEKMRSFKVGSPLLTETQVGPLARKDLQQQLMRQLQKSTKRGAKILLGGTLFRKKGFYFPPTVLADVNPKMPVFNEETFGPLAAIITAKSEDEAIRLANLSIYGLGSAIFSRDLDRALKISREIQAGITSINRPVASDPRLPFGGVKNSGYGRELGAFGIHEFSNIQTVWVE
jgi:succinate-semialdehyde dehydrogenase/glutarate-semialdehyde dehydrogenase